MFQLQDDSGECLATHYHKMGDRARENVGLGAYLGDGDNELVSVEYMDYNILRKLKQDFI